MMVSADLEVDDRRLRINDGLCTERVSADDGFLVSVDVLVGLCCRCRGEGEEGCTTSDVNDGEREGRQGACDGFGDGKLRKLGRPYKCDDQVLCHCRKSAPIKILKIITFIRRYSIFYEPNL